MSALPTCFSRRAISPLIAMGSMWACDAPPPPPPTFTAVDSAGVRIVENSRPGWTPGQQWSVAPEPRLSIGALDGAPEISFDGIVTVLRLPSGTIAVADAGSAQVRFFDGAGDFQRAFGGPGQGPGEFSYMQGAGARGDSIWIHDPRVGRLTIIDALSEAFRSAPLVSQRRSLGSAETLPDGSMIFAFDLMFAGLERGSMPPNGLQRTNAAYVLVSADGEPVDTVMVTKGVERIVRVGDGSVEIITPPFGRTVSHALRGERLLFGDQETYEIRLYGLDGSLVEIARRPGLDLTITQAARSEALEAAIALVPEEQRARMRVVYEGMELPPSRPAFRTFLVDALEHLWVQDFVPAGDATTWSVFSPENVWLGEVALPDGFVPTQVLEDEVLGIWRDDLDVQYVRSYGLTRP